MCNNLWFYLSTESSKITKILSSKITKNNLTLNALTQIMSGWEQRPKTNCYGYEWLSLYWLGLLWSLHYTAVPYITYSTDTLDTMYKTEWTCTWALWQQELLHARLNVTQHNIPCEAWFWILPNTERTLPIPVHIPFNFSPHNNGFFKARIYCLIHLSLLISTKIERCY